MKVLNPIIAFVPASVKFKSVGQERETPLQKVAIKMASNWLQIICKAGGPGSSGL